jgi:hypothetical protein
MKTRRRNAKSQSVVCIYNEDFKASLELQKPYRVIPDATAAEHGLLRVVDETGEDYLYPEEYFAPAEGPTSKKRVVMPKSTKNSGKRWKTSEVQRLKSLASKNTPTRVIGLKLGRSEAAVRSKATAKGISLKPTNQSPYSRKKK